MWDDSLEQWLGHHELCEICDQCGYCVEYQDDAVTVWQWIGHPYGQWVERRLCCPCSIQQALLGRRWSGPWFSDRNRGTRPPWAVRIKRLVGRP